MPLSIIGGNAMSELCPKCATRVEYGDKVSEGYYCYCPSCEEDFYKIEMQGSEIENRRVILDEGELYIDTEHFEQFYRELELPVEERTFKQLTFRTEKYVSGIKDKSNYLKVEAIVYRKPRKMVVSEYDLENNIISQLEKNGIKDIDAYKMTKNIMKLVMEVQNNECD